MKLKHAAVLGFVFAASGLAQQYTAQGEFVLPSDYRQWVFLTSDIGMTYADRASAHPPFTNIFVNPASYNAFLKTGTWPDKTVLLMEVRTSGTSPLGKDGGKYQTALSGFEARVKDASRGGWKFYGIRAGATSGKPVAKREACADCHEQHAATDTTFVQFYPTLIDAARKYGTYKEPHY